MFKRIDHVEIVTDQPAETVAFYTDILGFELTHDIGDLAPIVDTEVKQRATRKR